MTSTPTPTPDFANASAAVTGGFSNSMGLAETAGMLLVLAGVVGVLLAARSSVERYERLVRIGRAIGAVIGYALKGVVTAGVASLVVGPAYLVATADPSTQQQVGVYLGGGIVVVLALAGLGYVGERVYEPIAQHHADVTGRRPLERPDDDSDAEVAD